MSSLPSSLSPGTWHGSVMLEVPFTWLQRVAEACCGGSWAHLLCMGGGLESNAMPGKVGFRSASDIVVMAKHTSGASAPL